MATIEEFASLDIRVGTVVEATPCPEARTPALRLLIDFGPSVGTRQSSAQLTKRYLPDELVGRQIVAVVNFPPRRVAGFSSEVLVLGAVPADGDVILLSPDWSAPNGSRVA